MKSRQSSGLGLKKKFGARQGPTFFCFLMQDHGRWEIEIPGQPGRGTAKAGEGSNLRAHEKRRNPISGRDQKLAGRCGFVPVVTVRAVLMQVGVNLTADF